VLRFYGYFKESVVESRLENYRIRGLIIYYFLEDRSIMITEPKQVNSGTPQGAFLKR
jgi:EF-hand domain-containing protein 1